MPFTATAVSFKFLILMLSLAKTTALGSKFTLSCNAMIAFFAETALVVALNASTRPVSSSFPFSPSTPSSTFSGVAIPVCASGTGANSSSISLEVESGARKDPRRQQHRPR